MQENDDKCSKCGAPLGDVTETKTGRKLQRCSQGIWNPTTRQTDGCSFIKWLPFEPQKLDEKCPKCGELLVIQMTRFGKKMKKCSAGGWDREERKPTGCDYIEWIKGTTEPLDDKCPDCSEPLVLYTTTAGKRMIKCSKSGWDRETRQPTGCTYVQWLKPGEDPKKKADTGEEFLPPEEERK